MNFRKLDEFSSKNKLIKFGKQGGSNNQLAI
jgi:hypothetical protein